MKVAPREPRMPEIQAATQASAIVVQSDVFAFDAARQADGRDLNSCGFRTRYASIGNGNPPQQHRMKGPWRRNRVDVATFPSDIVGHARVVAYHKRDRRGGATLRSDHRDAI